MNRIYSHLITVALAASATAFFSGCAAESHLINTAEVVPADEVASVRAVIAEIQQHRYAKDIVADLQRAQRWLDDADRLIADGDGDSERAKLLVAAARTQLAVAKSFFLRREAENALENARSGYVQERDEAKALQKSNQQLGQ